MDTKVSNLTQSAYENFPIAWVPLSIPIPCDLYLAFEGGKKMIRWRAQGDVLNSEEIQKIDCVQVSRDDYLNLKSLAKQLPIRGRTDEGVLIATLLREDSIDVVARRILLEETAFQVLEEGLAVANSKLQNQWKLKIKNILLDCLEISLSLSGDIQSIIQNCEQHGGSRSAFETSALAFLMALATGQIEPLALKDLILAAFFQDLSSVTAGLSQTSIHQFKDDEWIKLKAAGRMTPAILMRLGIMLQNTAALVLADHHSVQTRNPRLQPLSQPLSCATLWTWFTSGRWDSQQRTPRETWVAINLLENMQALPYGVGPAFLTRLRMGLGDPSTAT